MEETELEEGEAYLYHNNHNNDDDDASIDPDIALSYIVSDCCIYVYLYVFLG